MGPALPDTGMTIDNDGGIHVKNRAYRRRKIQIQIDEKHLPKPKKRKKNNKKNYLNKRKK